MRRDSFAMLARVVIVGSIVLLSSLAARAQGAVLRGPYMLDVTTTSVRVAWESPEPSTGTVRFGVASVNEAQRELTIAARHQSVTLDNLTPNTSYLLQVEIAGHDTFNGSFRTAPTGAQPFAFVMYGDNRSSEEQHQAVVDAILNEPAPISFLVNTGDLVSDGQNESDWDSFFTVARPLLLEQPFFVAIGNHEVDGSDWSVTQRILEMDQAFFNVVYGNVELIILNVEVDNLFDFASGDQVEWLRSALENPPAGVDHRMVFIHQGPYSSKSGRSGNFWMRRWLDEFDAAGIDVIFSGHDHYAERGWSEVGIPYVIHGGGGAPLYDHLGVRTTEDHTIVYGETRLGYVVVEVDGPKVEVTMRGLDGEIVSYFAFGDAVNAECSVAADCGADPPFACPGGDWECRQSACEFVCPADDGFTLECFTDDACAERLGATCTGDARCERIGFEFFCVCDDSNECSQSSECEGRTPPVPNCDGTWACQDNVCEFTPANGVCDPPQQDAGVSDAGLDEGTDAGTSAPVDAGVTTADAGALDAPPPPVVSPPLTDPPGGCSCKGGPQSAMMFLAALGFMARARGRRGPRSKES